ncbi:hypothetical protein AMECASPLE_032268 [Ameca splendens]|uniref:Uncharacterized protein n=1 Tax=Ameca splendens TaxID=208324 RepID=A0ABV0YU27_9TELE
MHVRKNDCIAAHCLPFKRVLLDQSPICGTNRLRSPEDTVMQRWAPAGSLLNTGVQSRALELGAETTSTQSDPEDPEPSRFLIRGWFHRLSVETGTGPGETSVLYRFSVGGVSYSYVEVTAKTNKDADVFFTSLITKYRTISVGCLASSHQGQQCPLLYIIPSVFSLVLPVWTSGFFLNRTSVCIVKA